MCAEPMLPETTYPKETSSNPEGKSGLTEPTADPWTPAGDDAEPTVTITVDDEDSYIQSVTLTDTENVKQVVVTVLDENGQEVCISVTLSVYCAC